MKKVLLLTLIIGSLSITSFAQGVDKSFYRSPYKTRNIGSFDQGTALLSFGLGFPNVVSNYGYSQVSSPTLYAKFEHGFISDEIGIGGLLGFSTSNSKYYGNYKRHATALGVAVLGYYHFNKLIPVKNLDVYLGAGLMLRNVAYTYDDNFYGDDNHTDFNAFAVFKVGARYYVTRGFGFYAEAGYDALSTANIGITFRF